MTLLKSSIGYSWLTNQYGLAIDNVVAFEIVTPDGSVVNITEKSNPDLFFALRVRYSRHVRQPTDDYLF